MFGLVGLNSKKLMKQDICEYKYYYCGLCMGMGRNTGLISRCLINYEVCLAYLVADSVTVDTKLKTARCPFSIYRRVQYRDNPELLDKMANTNYILVYHKLIDDINDDNNTIAKIIELLMRKKYIGIKDENNSTVQAVIKGLQSIREMESADEKISVRDSAIPFGKLLEEAMNGCLSDPADDKVFTKLCKYVGMWIYIVDACLDLKKDIKHNKYNPLKAGYPDAGADEIITNRKDEIIDFLMSCKQSMQQLLELFSCGKNKTIIHDLFEYLLPREVADILK